MVISNAYASRQLGSDGGFVTLTMTLPTTGHLTNQAYAADAGLLLDLERPERFTPRALGIELSGTPRWQGGRGAMVGDGQRWISRDSGDSAMMADRQRLPAMI